MQRRVSESIDQLGVGEVIEESLPQSTRQLALLRPFPQDASAHIDDAIDACHGRRHQRREPQAVLGIEGFSPALRGKVRDHIVVTRGGRQQQRRIAVVVAPADRGDALALDQELGYVQPAPTGGEVERGVARDVGRRQGVWVVLEDAHDDREVVDVDCAPEAERNFQHCGIVELALAGRVLVVTRGRGSGGELELRL